MAFVALHAGQGNRSGIWGGMGGHDYFAGGMAGVIENAVAHLRHLHN
jgi:hypothetical protein